MERIKLAKSKLVEHGFNGWELRLDGAKARAGSCNHVRKLITFSRRYVCSNETTEKMFMDTVLHEIAHALAGKEAGHGKVWRGIALRIGCTGKRYIAPFMQPRYQVSCPCGAVSVTHHVVKPSLRGKVCRKCKQALVVRKAVHKAQMAPPSAST